MSKFVVVSCNSVYQIFEVGQADTIEAAQQLMRDSFKKIFCRCAQTEDNEKYEKEFNEARDEDRCEITDMEAWIDADICCTWKIIEVHC